MIFEITETAVRHDIEQGARFTKALYELGCGIGLDDFGTGYASLVFLQKLSLRFLKIDIEFVRDLFTTEANQCVVRAIISMARALDLETVAEGIEDQETWDFLRLEGVDSGHGLYQGRPAPLGQS